MLEKMDAQHPFNPNRPPARALRLGVIGLDDFAQYFPGNDLIHLFQKDLLAGLLTVFLEIITGKTLLAHRSLPN